MAPFRHSRRGPGAKARLKPISSCDVLQAKRLTRVRVVARVISLLRHSCVFRATMRKDGTHRENGAKWKVHPSCWRRIGLCPKIDFLYLNDNDNNNKGLALKIILVVNVWQRLHLRTFASTSTSEGLRTPTNNPRRISSDM